MATANRRTGEKGQRTPRSMDAYRGKGGIRGAVYCQCGAVYRNKRWFLEDEAAGHKEGREHVCPACRRVADRNPAGVVTLSGDYRADHASEINNLINVITKRAQIKNPLGRIMDISEENDDVIITTTDVKLAQKIGREIYRSHGGQLHFIWSHAEAPVRVKWSC